MEATSGIYVLQKAGIETNELETDMVCEKAIKAFQGLKKI